MKVIEKPLLDCTAGTIPKSVSTKKAGMQTNNNRSSNNDIECLFTSSFVICLYAKMQAVVIDIRNIISVTTLTITPCSLCSLQIHTDYKILNQYNTYSSLIIIRNKMMLTMLITTNIIPQNSPLFAE